MTSNITSYSDLITWSTTNNATNNIEILNSFEIPIGSTPLVLDSAIGGAGINITINGNGYELTIMNTSAYDGLFKLPDAGSLGTFNFNDIGFNLTSGIGINGALTGNCANAGSGYTINVNNCYLTGANCHISCGGLLGTTTKNFLVNNCYVVAKSLTGHNTGGICCEVCSNGIIKNSFTYFTQTISSSQGGIAGAYPSNIQIYNCYSSCNVNSNGGIICGKEASNVVIENCYALGIISGAKAGGIVGAYSQNIKIKNCYVAAVFEETYSDRYAIGYNITNSSTIDNVYALNALSEVSDTNKGLVDTSSTVTINTSGYASVEGVWDESFTYLLNSYTSTDTTQTYTNIWSDSTTFNSPPENDEPYMLSVFSTDPWNHTTYDSDLGFLASSEASGDPHITTFSGNKYDFDYLGSFRLFDNNHPDENKRIIINGKSMLGDSDNWDKKQYIRKIFICIGKKRTLINTGFRGEKAHVIMCKGFSILDKELKVNHKSKVHCWNCDYSVYQHKNYRIKEHVLNTLHTMKKPIRNKLYFSEIVDGQKISFCIENVNQYNVQPCRFFIRGMEHQFLENATGCMMDKKYSSICKLDNIKSLNVPELTE